MKKIYFFIVLSALLYSIVANAQTEPLTKFSTGGNIVYQLAPGFNGTDHVITSAAYNGEIQCFTQSGTELWANDIGEGFPFDIENGDIDMDGKDEFMVASSDGKLYTYDDDGSLLWTYETAGPLYVVKAVNVDGVPYIFTGGVTKKVIMLSGTGQFLKQQSTVGAVRLLETGNIKGTGVTYLAAADAQRTLSGNYTLRLLELPSFNQEWQTSMKYPNGASGRFYTIDVFDINNDGKDEMIFSLDHRNPRTMAVYRHDGTDYSLSASFNTRAYAYKMNLFEHIYSSTLGDEYIIHLFGDILYIRNLNGSLRQELNGPYAMNACVFDSSTNTYWLGSELSGGDGIYGLHLDRTGWENAYKSLKPAGQMNQLEANLQSLADQVAGFEKPIYQPEVKKVPVVPGEKTWGNLENKLKPDTYENVEFGLYVNWTEDYDRSSNPSPWNTKKDHRWPYDLSQDEIVNKARAYEQNNQPFSVWAGHGLDPFYMQLSTMQKILEVAPNTLQAFIFPELERTDLSMKNAVNQHIKPLADLCLEHNKKILLRNKNIFWNGTCYLDLWWSIFKDKKYREVFVISMEETSDHLQSWSLAGRTGLWLTEHFDVVSGRAVTDNSNWLRIYEWCSTQKLSNQIRFMSLNRMYGADFFHLNFHTGNETDMIPFYQMLEKGILPNPDRDDIVSLSDLAIGMKIPPDKDYEDQGTNHHVLKNFNPNEEMKVIDKIAAYWGGAPVPEHDFTRIAFNSKRRMTNFLSQAPYGNIAVIPATTDITQYDQFNKMIVTDGKYWYDENNQPQTASAYKDEVVSALEEAASRLPIRVSGEVSWVAVKLDPGRTRLLLIDPGYLDPADRDVVIHLQNMNDVIAHDILRNENLSVVNNEISLTVPMGIMRIIDLISFPIASAGEDIYIDSIPVDSVVFYGTAEDDIEITSYQWEKISGPECTLLQADSATLIVKNVDEGEYTFRFTVTDNDGNTDSDEVNLTIYCIPCNTPEVDAGSNRNVRLPKDTLQLKGSVIYDGNGIDSFKWDIYTGPEATISNDDSEMAVVSNLLAGIYKFSFTATSTAGYSHTDFVEVEVLPEILSPDTIPKNTSHIIIDGVKEQYWCGQKFEIDSLVFGHFDTYSAVNLMWDDTSLYAFFEIEDKFRIDDSGDDWWEDDAIEIYIDADNSKGNTFDSNDFRYGIGLVDATLYESIHNATDNIEYQVVQSGDYYYVEISIPWEQLKFSPTLHDLIGIEIRILDDYDWFFTDAIEALFGYSGEEEPTPIQFGELALGTDCTITGSPDYMKNNNIQVIPTITNSKVRFISNQNSQTNFLITDVYGRIIMKDHFIHTKTIDLNMYPDGIYFLIFEDQITTRVQKIIKTNR